MNVLQAASAPSSDVLPNGATSHSRRGGLEDAAQKFEALLMTQLLRAARQGAADGTEADKTGASLMEMGEETLAEVLANQGGLGLANLIVERMSSNFESPKSPVRR